MNELMNNLNRKNNLVFVHMLNILNITFNPIKYIHARAHIHVHCSIENNKEK